MSSWLEPQDVLIPDEFQRGVGGHPLVAEVLARRGVTDLAKAKAFLDPQVYTPTSPWELPGMERAVARLIDAMRKDEAICVWGDFDVDGQTATTLLVSTLKELGANVTYHIPVRETESHGVNLLMLQQVIQAGAQLILTCDTGISAHSAVDYANARGVDVIVTDHHDLPEQMPAACALVNPKLLTPGHPLVTLPGVGVAYQLAEALYEQTGHPGGVSQFLDLVALGIVADLALLRGENRYLLQRGIEALRAPTRLGLKVMLDLAEIDPAGLTEEHIGYVLGPRLNALGRLSDANQAVEFLTTLDYSRARLLAEQLEGLNAERQLQTEQVFQAAQAQIERDPSLLDSAALVLSHPTWPAGVIGIVASRLVERYNRPVVLISAQPGGIARGSARSVAGCNITAAIAAQAELLVSYGGHPMAAGLAIPTERIPEFRRALSKTVREMLGEGHLEKIFKIDAYLPLSGLSLELVANLERLAPFGAGNLAVTLACPRLILISQSTFGRRAEHLHLIVADEQGVSHKVIWWGGAGWPLPEALLNGARFDLAYVVRASDYRGQRELQVEWVEARQVAEPALELPPTACAINVQDYRRQDHPLPLLKALLAQGDVQVWAEGEALERLVAQGIAARQRSALENRPGLAIWTSPPGPAELQAVLAAVSPQTVYLFGVDPKTDRLEAFLSRLAGLVKFALRSNQGQASLSALAAATPQRQITIRAGIDWLAARGQLAVLSEEGDEIFLGEGIHQESARLLEITARLQELLAETTAYRAYFSRAEPDALILTNDQRRLTNENDRPRTNDE